eukprot:COSAG02_NODE_3600_length_6506_cov_24.718433_2_plen_106_part_00
MGKCTTLITLLKLHNGSYPDNSTTPAFCHVPYCVLFQMDNFASGSVARSFMEIRNLPASSALPSAQAAQAVRGDCNAVARPKFIEIVVATQLIAHTLKLRLLHAV